MDYTHRRLDFEGAHNDKSSLQSSKDWTKSCNCLSLSLVTLQGFLPFLLALRNFYVLFLSSRFACDRVIKAPKQPVVISSPIAELALQRLEKKGVEKSTRFCTFRSGVLCGSGLSSLAERIPVNTALLTSKKDEHYSIEHSKQISRDYASFVKSCRKKKRLYYCDADGGCPLLARKPCYRPFTHRDYILQARTVERVFSALDSRSTEKILFVGDSISITGHFYNFMCSIGHWFAQPNWAWKSFRTRGGGRVPGGRETDPSRCFIGRVSKAAERKADDSHERSASKKESGHVLICGLSAGKAWPPTLLTRVNSFRGLLKGGDIVLVNSGWHWAHRPSEAVKQLNSVWRSVVRQFQFSTTAPVGIDSRRRKFHCRDRPPTFIHRETSQTYFHSPLSDGLHKHMREKSNVSWLVSPQVKTALNAPWSNGCVPISERIKRGNSMFEAALSDAKHFGIPTLHSRSETVKERAPSGESYSKDAPHLDLIGHARKKKTPDCNHFCEWGREYALWNDRLVDIAWPQSQSNKSEFCSQLTNASAAEENTHIRDHADFTDFLRSQMMIESPEFDM